jgi:hypothetical protein
MMRSNIFKYGVVRVPSIPLFFLCTIRGSSTIKLKNASKKRMVTARRTIIFLNFSRQSFVLLKTIV